MNKKTYAIIHFLKIQIFTLIAHHLPNIVIELKRKHIYSLKYFNSIH